MWEATASDVPGGRKHRVLEDGSELSFRQVFERLRSSEEFADWYTDTLARHPVSAFYWELPPLTTSTHRSLSWSKRLYLRACRQIRRRFPHFSTHSRMTTSWCFRISVATPRSLCPARAAHLMRMPTWRHSCVKAGRTRSAHCGASPPRPCSIGSVTRRSGSARLASASSGCICGSTAGRSITVTVATPKDDL